MRNVVMSGFSSATVIAEAGETSGTRIQARAAVRHGRPLILSKHVAENLAWAREMLGAGFDISVADTAEEAVDLVLALHERRDRAAHGMSFGALLSCVSGENYDALERVIRGAYRNVPPPAAGLCVSCTAPTSSPAYLSVSVPCDSFARSGMKTASGGVVPLSWAPMDSQGYQDLRQYKEPSATADQLGRLRTMFALAFSRHTTCIASSDPSRPLGVAHIPSTSGLRPGEHPFETHIMSMLASSVPRVSIRYVGSTDGTRNSRRSLGPGSMGNRAPADATEQSARLRRHMGKRRACAVGRGGLRATRHRVANRCPRSCPRPVEERSRHLSSSAPSDALRQQYLPSQQAFALASANARPSGYPASQC